MSITHEFEKMDDNDANINNIHNMKNNVYGKVPLFLAPLAAEKNLEKKITCLVWIWLIKNREKIAVETRDSLMNSSNHCNFDLMLKHARFKEIQRV